MATKVVNGEHITMTPEEEAAHIASHPIRPPEPLNPTEIEIIREALKTKRVITEADLTAAKGRLMR